ncbi:3'-5' RNA helicase YTHDC2-like [Rhynchophorus ferrugineus]|uniref:3'-5' RNA helicase YTHDC2-like n=1 Tax=Rhynchophorus ferrugineus TaxID=354439 RepID=UPI003FCEDDDA
MQQNNTFNGDNQGMLEFDVVRRRFEDYDDNPMFLLIRASEKRNIDIAQSCKKWVFSPQTEKKVLYYSSKGKIIYLIYYIKELEMVMGIAEYRSMSIGQRNNKPTAIIYWLYKGCVPKNKIRHLRNPYDYRKPISESLDGVVIQQGVAEELIRIYNETGKKG